MYSGSAAFFGASTPNTRSSCWNVTNPTLCPMPNRKAFGTKPLYRDLGPSSRHMVARVGNTLVYFFWSGSWL
jgi:hypothetical protein